MRAFNNAVVGLAASWEAELVDETTSAGCALFFEGCLLSIDELELTFWELALLVRAATGLL